MFCMNCGTKNEDDSLFCFHCGTRLYKPAMPEHQPTADQDIQTPETVQETEVPEPVQAVNVQQPEEAVGPTVKHSDNMQKQIRDAEITQPMMTAVTDDTEVLDINEVVQEAAQEAAQPETETVTDETVLLNVSEAAAAEDAKAPAETVSEDSMVFAKPDMDAMQRETAWMHQDLHTYEQTAQEPQPYAQPQDAQSYTQMRDAQSYTQTQPYGQTAQEPQPYTQMQQDAQAYGPLYQGQFQNASANQPLQNQPRLLTGGRALGIMCLNFLHLLPVIGTIIYLIIMIVMACDKKDPNKAGMCKGILFWMLIQILILIVLILAFGSAIYALLARYGYTF